MTKGVGATKGGGVGGYKGKGGVTKGGGGATKGARNDMQRAANYSDKFRIICPAVSLSGYPIGYMKDFP